MANFVFNLALGRNNLSFVGFAQSMFNAEKTRIFLSQWSWRILMFLARFLPKKVGLGKLSNEGRKFKVENAQRTHSFSAVVGYRRKHFTSSLIPWDRHGEEQVGRRPL